MICPGEAFRGFPGRAGLPVSVQRNVEVHLGSSGDPSFVLLHHDVGCILITESFRTLLRC